MHELQKGAPEDRHETQSSSKRRFGSIVADVVLRFSSPMPYEMKPALLRPQLLGKYRGMW